MFFPKRFVYVDFPHSPEATGFSEYSDKPGNEEDFTLFLKILQGQQEVIQKSCQTTHQISDLETTPSDEFLLLCEIISTEFLDDFMLLFDDLEDEEDEDEEKHEDEDEDEEEEEDAEDKEKRREFLNIQKAAERLAGWFLQFRQDDPDESQRLLIGLMNHCAADSQSLIRLGLVEFFENVGLKMQQFKTPEKLPPEYELQMFQWRDAFSRTFISQPSFRSELKSFALFLKEHPQYFPSTVGVMSYAKQFLEEKDPEQYFRFEGCIELPLFFIALGIEPSEVFRVWPDLETPQET